MWWCSRGRWRGAVGGAGVGGGVVLVVVMWCWRGCYCGTVGDASGGVMVLDGALVRGCLWCWCWWWCRASGVVVMVVVMSVFVCLSFNQSVSESVSQ